jgi:nitroreductase
MNFSELINKRYSVRKYKPVPVEENKLARILDAGRLAPTAANRQPFRILVVKTGGKQEELKPIYAREWFTGAPLLLVVCGVPAEAWVRSYDNKNHVDVDASIVADHLIMAATDEGLGTCWIAAFDPKAAKKILNIPEGQEPVICITLGYADDSPKEKKRKTFEELVKYL